MQIVSPPDSCTVVRALSKESDWTIAWTRITPRPLTFVSSAGDTVDWTSSSEQILTLADGSVVRIPPGPGFPREYQVLDRPLVFLKMRIASTRGRGFATLIAEDQRPSHIPSEEQIRNAVAAAIHPAVSPDHPLTLISPDKAGFSYSLEIPESAGRTCLLHLVGFDSPDAAAWTQSGSGIGRESRSVIRPSSLLHTASATDLEAYRTAAKRGTVLFSAVIDVIKGTATLLSTAETGYIDASTNDKSLAQRPASSD